MKSQRRGGGAHNFQLFSVYVQLWTGISFQQGTHTRESIGFAPDTLSLFGILHIIIFFQTKIESKLVSCNIL